MHQLLFQKTTFYQDSTLLLLTKEERDLIEEIEEKEETELIEEIEEKEAEEETEEEEEEAEEEELR